MKIIKLANSLAKQSSELAKQSSELAKQSSELAKQSSELAKQSAWLDNDDIQNGQDGGKLPRNHDGLPLCPNCKTSLIRVNANDRDVETMGGSAIQYLSCEKCNGEWELKDDGHQENLTPSFI